MWVDRLAAAERDGHRAQREVARRQVGLDRLASQRRRIELPGAVTGGRPPGRKLPGELEGVAIRLPGHGLGGGRGIACDGQVQVRHVAAEGSVSYGATDDPYALPGQGPPGGGHERRGGESVGEAHSGVLGTRAEIPQVIS